MFTGIIEKIGKVTRVTSTAGNRLLKIEADLELKPGDSIATNGVCLTVIKNEGKSFMVESVAETLKTTNIGHLQVGDLVNLERPLAIGDRLGGHFVTGHIDELAKILSLKKLSGSTIMEIGITPKNLAYLVNKGSIAVEGVSLTVCGLSRQGFSVSLIPFTLNNTTFGKKRVGDLLNIEYDLLAKHIVKLASNK